MPVDKSDAALNGQCVALIKNLYEFLGAPNPYAGRGNATSALTTAENQGIATPGDGWLRICVNHSFAGGYGHIWIDLRNETNYESNGARRLVVTKNTRPISQAQQIGNLDKYVNFSQPAPAPAPATAPNGITPQRGTFQADTVRNIRWDSPAGQVGGLFAAGASQAYDGYTDFGGFRYVTWRGASGHRCYTAVRRLSDNKRYGRCF